MTAIVALVTDLMDRSRIESALPFPVEFVRRVEELPNDATLVLADLRRVPDPARLRVAAPQARIVAFAAHVDDETLDAARRAGLDDVMPRSAFFRTVSRLIE